MLVDVVCKNLGKILNFSVGKRAIPPETASIKHWTADRHQCVAFMDFQV